MSQLELLLGALGRFHTLRAGVIGDLMVDRFIYGSATRLSPEAPVPVVHIRERATQPGGAANVGHNILSLGAQLSLFGVLGDDEAGREVRAILEQRRADLRGMILLPDRASTIKTRVVAQAQQLVRFDEEETAAIDESIASELFHLAGAQINTLSVMVFSDYDKGVFSASLVQRLLALCKRAGVLSLADPKPANIASFAGVDVIKPNLGEALRLAGMEREPDAVGMQHVCRAVRERAQAGDVIITAGGRGMFVLAGEKFAHLPGHQREVYDVAGAGDTALATVALGLAAGLPLADAAQLGNLAGSIAVGKLGVAAVTSAELRTELEEFYGHA